MGRRTTDEDIRREIAKIREVMPREFAEHENNGHIDYSDCIVSFDKNGYSVVYRNRGYQPATEDT